MERFIKHPSNPIYGGKNTGTLFDVYVTKQDGRFRMDFSWRPMKSLAVAFSDDGIHWTDPAVTLPPDETTGWEDDCNRNCVLQTPRGWEMWYTGQARGHSFLGHAISEDGMRFTRDVTEPILFCERAWEGMSVMNPCVLYEDGLYRMWYAAGETYEPNVLAYAESRDGIHWVKSPINPIFVKNTAAEFEQNRVGGCQVLRHPAVGYLMFYIGYRDIDTAHICCAASPDGVTRWKRWKGNPVAAPDAGAWDGEACYKPSALYDAEKDQWQVWYNGRTGCEEYIGTLIGHGDFRPEDFE